MMEACKKDPALKNERRETEREKQQKPDYKHQRELNEKQWDR